MNIFDKLKAFRSNGSQKPKRLSLDEIENGLQEAQAERSATRNAIAQAVDQRTRLLLEGDFEQIEKLDIEVARNNLRLEAVAEIERVLLDEMQLRREAATKVAIKKHFEIALGKHAALDAALEAADRANKAVRDAREKAVSELGEATVARLIPGRVFLGMLHPAADHLPRWRSEWDTDLKRTSEALNPTPPKPATPTPSTPPQSVKPIAPHKPMPNAAGHVIVIMNEDYPNGPGPFGEVWPKGSAVYMVPAAAERFVGGGKARYPDRPVSPASVITPGEVPKRVKSARRVLPPTVPEGFTRCVVQRAGYDPGDGFGGCHLHEVIDVPSDKVEIAVGNCALEFANPPAVEQGASR